MRWARRPRGPLGARGRSRLASRLANRDLEKRRPASVMAGTFRARPQVCQGSRCPPRAGAASRPRETGNSSRNARLSQGEFRPPRRRWREFASSPNTLRNVPVYRRNRDAPFADQGGPVRGSGKPGRGSGKKSRGARIGPAAAADIAGRRRTAISGLDVPVLFSYPRPMPPHETRVDPPAPRPCPSPTGRPTASSPIRATRARIRSGRSRRSPPLSGRSGSPIRSWSTPDGCSSPVTAGCSRRRRSAWARCRRSSSPASPRRRCGPCASPTTGSRSAPAGTATVPASSSRDLSALDLDFDLR